MNKSFSSFLKQQLDLECLLCLQQYDGHKKEPVEVCSNHHFFCKLCVTSQKFKKDITTCPMCRETISQKSIKPLHAYIFIEKVKSFVLHTETHDVHISQKLKKTQDDLKNSLKNLQTVLNNEKKLQQQSVKLQKQIQKLNKQIKSKQEILISQRLRKQEQKQNYCLNSTQDHTITDNTTARPNNNTSLKDSNCGRQSIWDDQKQRRNLIIQQKSDDQQKKPCKVCNIKQIVLCFGIVCLKCFKKQKI